LDDPFLTFCTGFFKPYIGISFALFALAVTKSDLIIINTTHLAFLQPSAYMALAFVSGFSERFASDFITRAESRFGMVSASTPPNGALQEAPPNITSARH
jgi:hypothetical protein